MDKDVLLEELRKISYHKKDYPESLKMCLHSATFSMATEYLMNLDEITEKDIAYVIGQLST